MDKPSIGISSDVRYSCPPASRREKLLAHNRGIYLLPNLLTSAGLFSAFYAIMAAMQQDIEHGVIAIFIGMVADVLDGRVARLTNTQSAFGAQYDSLSDMVAFGVAPSLVVYSWTLRSLGHIGWLIAFFYTASVALRLARFNAQHDVADYRYFVGLPCTAAAGWVSGMIWFLSHWVSGPKVVWTVAVIVSLIAGLMVSNFSYYSFKDVDFKGRVPFVAVVSVALIFVLIAIYPAMILFVAFSLYGLSGPIYTLYRLKVRRKARRRLADMSTK